MRSILQCAAMTILLFVQPPASGQEGQADTEKPDNIQKLVKTLSGDIDELRFLSESIGNAEKSDRDALILRRDTRSFRVLKDLAVLVTRAVAAPDTAPYKAELMLQLTAMNETASDAIFERISEIDERISQTADQPESGSAVDQIERRAHLQSLEDIRIRYYEALLGLLQSRKMLGLTSENLRERLDAKVSLYAEVLAGRIEYFVATRALIQNRAGQMPDDKDLKAALMDLEVLHKRTLGRLHTLVPVLDGLGMDSSKYKTVLLQQAGNISVSLFSSQALYAVLVETWVTATNNFKANGPDLLLNLLILIAVLFVFRILARVTRRVVRAAINRSGIALSNLLKNMLVSLSGGSIMAIGILIALSYIGISVTPMLAGLGVAGFIIGFALQDSLSNFAAGAMILIYRPYDVNDFVEVTGASGLVKKMSLVTTTIVTFDNQTLVVPNQKIWGDVIKNVTAQKQRRVDLQFGISYTDDVELAERILTEIVTAHAKVLKDPEPNIRLHSLGDSSVNFIVRPWTKTDDYWEVYWDITREVKLRFDREGISIPFPQRDVHVYTATTA